MGFFDKKNTTSTTSTVNQQIDQRAVGDNGSTVVSGNVSGGLAITDGGAIKGAFDFLEKTDAAMTARFSKLLDVGDKFVTGGQAQAAATLGAVQEAQKSAANPNQNLMMVGILAASVVAVFVFKGR